MVTARVGKEPESPCAISIDMGSSTTRIAFWRKRDVVVIPNGRGLLATPSCVAFTDRGVLIGDEAAEQAASNIENTIHSPQQFLGFRYSSPWMQSYKKMWPHRFVCGNGYQLLIRVMDRQVERLLRAEEVVTILLEGIRKAAERVVGSTIREVVLTVPGGYGRLQRQALRAAAHGARMEVLDLLRAPTAAGIAYSLMHASSTSRRILMCDFGYAHFDVAVLSVEGGSCHVTELAVNTDHVHFLETMVRYCQQDLLDRYAVDIDGDSKALQQLRSSCESAKRNLSLFRQARIEVDDITQGLDYMLEMSRSQFEEMCKADFKSLLGPIESCLEDADTGRADVDAVVLVGGSVRMPKFRKCVRDFFYGLPMRELRQPEHAVVLGAAAYAAVLSVSRINGKDGVPPELRAVAVRHVENRFTARGYVAPQPSSPPRGPSALLTAMKATSSVTSAAQDPLSRRDSEQRLSQEKHPPKPAGSFTEDVASTPLQLLAPRRDAEEPFQEELCFLESSADPLGYSDSACSGCATTENSSATVQEDPDMSPARRALQEQITVLAETRQAHEASHQVEEVDAEREEDAPAVAEPMPEPDAKDARDAMINEGDLDETLAPCDEIERSGAVMSIGIAITSPIRTPVKQRADSTGSMSSLELNDGPLPTRNFV